MSAPDLKTATYGELLTYVESAAKYLIGQPYNPSRDIPAFEQILRGMADALSPLDDPIICIGVIWVDTRTIRFDPATNALTVDAVPDPKAYPFQFTVTVGEVTP